MPTKHTPLRCASNVSPSLTLHVLRVVAAGASATRTAAAMTVVAAPGGTVEATTMSSTPAMTPPILPCSRERGTPCSTLLVSVALSAHEAQGNRRLTRTMSCHVESYRVCPVGCRARSFSHNGGGGRSYSSSQDSSGRYGGGSSAGGSTNSANGSAYNYTGPFKGTLTMPLRVAYAPSHTLPPCTSLPSEHH